MINPDYTVAGSSNTLEPLWSSSAKVRNKTAKIVTSEAEARFQNDLCNNCPADPWPYGITTSINPVVATLGVSPGNSPYRGDKEFVTRVSQPLPKVGVPHPGTHYQDTAGYWDKLRTLVRIIFGPTGLSGNEALSLFANLNLDIGASGVADRVDVRADFASWVLLNARDRLRPRFLICLGLSGYLQKNLMVRKILENVFDGFTLSKPHREFRFKGYTVRNLIFREWDVCGPHNNEIKIVLWPQHPSRSPFTNSSFWAASCEEFASRHGHLIE